VQSPRPSIGVLSTRLRTARPSAGSSPAPRLACASHAKSGNVPSTRVMAPLAIDAPDDFGGRLPYRIAAHAQTHAFPKPSFGRRSEHPGRAICLGACPVERLRHARAAVERLPADGVDIVEVGAGRLRAERRDAVVEADRLDVARGFGLTSADNARSANASGSWV